MSGSSKGYPSGERVWHPRGGGRASRVFAWMCLMLSGAALGTVVLLPALKGMPRGYLPVLLGACLAAGAWKMRRRWGHVAPAGPLLIIGAIAALGVQCGLILWLRPEPWYDALNVYRQAREYSLTGSMPRLTYYPPLQIWYYGLLFRLFGGSVLVAQLSNVVPAAGLLVALYRLGSAGGNRRAGGWAVVCCAAYPSFIFYILVTPYYFYSFTFLVVLSGYLAVRSIAGGGRYAVASGLSSGAAALAQPVWLLAPLVAAVFYAVSKQDWKIRLSRWMLFATTFLLVLVPWTLRNLQVHRGLVPVCTAGGFVLYSANNPCSDGLYSSLADQVDVNDPVEMLRISRSHARRALQFVVGHPARFLRLALRKFLFTWGTEATYGELLNVKGEYRRWLDDGVSLVVQTAWSGLVILWMAASLRIVRNPRRLNPVMLWCAVVVLLLSAVYVIFEGGARHHLPMVPLILTWISNAVVEERMRRDV